MNLLQIAGRIGKDAEVRHTQSGDAVASFDVAVEQRIKGEKVTTWVRCSLWGERAGKAAPYLTKGTAIAISGEARATAYMPRDGDKPRAQLECRVDRMTFLGGGERGRDQPAQRDEAPKPAARNDEFHDDDIPF